MLLQERMYWILQVSQSRSQVYCAVPLFSVPLFSVPLFSVPLYSSRVFKLKENFIDYPSVAVIEPKQLFTHFTL